MLHYFTYLLLSLLTGSPDQRNIDTGLFAIMHVDVIPMDKERILKDQVVIIRNGKIVYIGNAKSVNVPAGATRIDAKGKYMMPGLMDMHVHFFYEQGISENNIPVETRMMVVNGITTARVMNGDPEYLRVKKQIANGEIPGPELFVMSPQFVGQWPFRGQFFGEIIKTPREAEEAVHKFKSAGYDGIKITFYIKRSIYDAIIAAAKKANIKVTGHVGQSVKLRRALEAKQQVEHYDEFLEMLLPDSSVNRGNSVSGPGIWNPEAWNTIEHLDLNRIPNLVKVVKASGIAVTPTNFFLHSSFGRSTTEEEIRATPGFPFIPDTLLSERFEVREIFWKDPPSENQRKIFIDVRQKITMALYKAGVPLLAGSDSPEWFLVQGFSLHDELEEFVKAGLSNYAALQTATTNPAKYLGIEKRKGMISVGKDADFILLSKNPLDDIRNTRAIYGVMAKGKYYNLDKP